MKGDRSVARAALTQEVASWRRSALTWRCFWESVSWSTALVSVGTSSGEPREVEKDLRRELETREEVVREAWKERNCSTVGWGSSSLADELNSAYMLQR